MASLNTVAPEVLRLATAVAAAIIKKAISANCGPRVGDRVSSVRRESLPTAR